MIDIKAMAQELLTAHQTGAPVPVPPSARQPGFTLEAAYGVEREIVRLRQHAGHTVRGLKVGFANKAMWRALKLETVAWARMYDDTVRHAAGNRAELVLDNCLAPRIEPEIVFSLKRPIETAGLDAVTVLREHVEWIALGFEIIDCPFPEWKFQAADFVAALGLHKALVVGEPLPITVPLDEDAASHFVDQLARFTVRLSKDGELAEEGAGKNSLRNPALCLAELGGAMARQRVESGDTGPVGNLVSSGTLTAGRDIASGQTWRAEIDGLDLEPLELRFA